MEAVTRSLGEETPAGSIVSAQSGAITPAASITVFNEALVKKQLNRYVGVMHCTTLTGMLLLISAACTLIGVLVRTVWGNIADLSAFKPEFAAVIIACLLVGAFLLRTSSRMSYSILNECDKQQRLSRQG